VWGGGGGAKSSTRLVRVRQWHQNYGTLYWFQQLRRFHADELSLAVSAVELVWILREEA